MNFIMVNLDLLAIAVNFAAKFIGAEVGIGIVFAGSPELEKNLFSYTLLGFALMKAIALFAIMLAFVIYILSVLERFLFLYRSSLALTYAWGFGSMAVLFLAIQILSGLILSMYYIPQSQFIPLHMSLGIFSEADFAESSMLGFQESVMYSMQTITALHNYVMFYLIGIFVIVCILLYALLIAFGPNLNIIALKHIYYYRTLSIFKSLVKIFDFIFFILYRSGVSLILLINFAYWYFFTQLIIVM